MYIVALHLIDFCWCLIHLQRHLYFGCCSAFMLGWVEALNLQNEHYAYRTEASVFYKVIQNYCVFFLESQKVVLKKGISTLCRCIL